jgi:hypothetical protein
MPAKRLPSILASFTIDQAFETTKIQFVAVVLPSHTGTCHAELLPLAPHQTNSDAGLIDGGMLPRSR